MRRAAEVGTGAQGPEIKVRSLAAGGAAQCVFFGVDFSGVFSSETRSGIGGRNGLPPPSEGPQQARQQRETGDGTEAAH